MKYQKWHIGTASEQDTALLKEAGYPSLLATVLAARGITTSEAAAEALERETSLTISPMLMRDMDKAVARIQKALANDETIAVFGDYDVDGITSTVLLLDYLKNCGAKCLRYIPRRIEDGYGLSKDAIQGLRDKGVTLMITVDCGITGNEEIDFAASIGMDVVVTDHHECKENLPRAVAVVDPHRPDDTYPFKYLAGVGVALKLVLALGGPDRENALFARYCTLAAIGTIADVMRMEGENRTIVSCGLAALNHTDFVGIHALLKEAGLLGKPITSIQIGFVLSPRINAAGRMGAADLAADLLQETDPAKAEELAKQLCDLNRERQAVEQSICADAIAQIERLRPEERNALVLSSEEWHQGVVGIVASRLSEKYAAPSFMIHLKDGSGKGSCRSYGGFNLFSALESCSDLLDGFGGHELAAGFTIPEENIDTFRQRMNRFVKAASGGERAVSCLEVDAAISNPADMTLEQVDHLAQLEPYGSGNPRPVFALLGATVDSVQAVGQGKHLKLRLSKGPSRFDAIFFSMPEAAAQLEPGCRVDAAFYLQANTFRGTTTLQLQLVDLRPSLTPSRHEAESLDLLHRLTGEQPLTAQETARLMISRDQFAAFWRILDRHLKQGKLDAVINEVVLAEDRIDGLLDDLALAVGDGNNAQLRLLAGDKNIARFFNARGKQQCAGHGQRHISSAAGISERLFEGDRAQAGSRIEHDDLTVLEIRSHLYSDGIVIVLRENQKDELTALNCLLHIAVGFDERLFAVHHAYAGFLAQGLYIFCSKCCHNQYPPIVMCSV